MVSLEVEDPRVRGGVLAQVYKRNYGGMYTWIECGCLCELDPEYAEGQIMDWAHGLAYGYFKKNEHRFIVHTLPIVKGKVVFEGLEITA